MAGSLFGDQRDTDIWMRITLIDRYIVLYWEQNSFFSNFVQKLYKVIINMEFTWSSEAGSFRRFRDIKVLTHNDFA